MTLRVVAWACAGALVLVWLIVLAAGLDPEALCPDRPDGSSLGAELVLWPPGTIECTAVFPGGATERWTRFPWDGWASVVLVAVGAACAASAPFRRGGRLALAVAAALLVPGAAAVWFL